MKTHLQFTLTLSKSHHNDLFKFISDKKENYQITHTIVSLETNPKEHFHILNSYNLELEDSWKQQNNLVKTLVEKYNLRKQQKGGQLNYTNGRKKGTVQDIDNCISYITKENNIKFFGWDPKHIEYRQSQSFIKKDSDKIDYQKLLKDKILVLWEEAYPMDYHAKFLGSIFPKVRKIETYYEGSNNLVYEDIYKQVEVIQKFVFKHLLEENKDIKSFTLVKSITRYIIQYSKNYYIMDNRFELFKNNN